MLRPRGPFDETSHFSLRTHAGGRRRARAAHDIFHPLDGKFDDNVIIQIKHGPIDFQVREPASPLFAALQHTSQAIELQITQEYLGQQRHMVFLVPMWKTTLDTDMRAIGTQSAQTFDSHRAKVDKDIDDLKKSIDVARQRL